MVVPNAIEDAILPASKNGIGTSAIPSARNRLRNPITEV